MPRGASLSCCSKPDCYKKTLLPSLSKILQQKRHVEASHWNPSKCTHFNTDILRRIAQTILVKIPVEMCQFILNFRVLNLIFVAEFYSSRTERNSVLQSDKCNRIVITILVDEPISTIVILLKNCFDIIFNKISRENTRQFATIAMPFPERVTWGFFRQSTQRIFFSILLK